ncbi:3D domain-containing protein [Paenibacillus aquistagni]|uniref:3D (Asp-Asp-Asp) domain-containing protein n=1 Tax=Paenibacillus aquistagni TaxID=1852522 RepID=A0A1X7J9E8_9BACL|nr:3D domain-containing protein [Paenibacillus aquistagni]SMG24139.1 3D (Asp-Asp-Asp) domain-containing protein [Paenibacillus aquistagni]
MKKRLLVTVTGVLLSVATVLAILPVYASSDEPEGSANSFYTVAQEYKLGMESLLADHPMIAAKDTVGGIEMSMPAPTKEFQALNPLHAASVQAEGQASSEEAKPATEAKAAKSAAATPVNKPKKNVPKNVITINGRDMKYAKKLSMKATAYTAHPSENGPWGAVDALGNDLKLGTVAVDPDVIPLGTKLFVTGYQFRHLPEGGYVAVASDTGSKIKKKRIDLFVPVSKKVGSTFGVQQIEVYVLK